jgi:hypothetical protein
VHYYEQAPFRYCQVPEIGIEQALVRCATDVLHVMTEFPETLHRHARDILVDQDLHPSKTGKLKGRDLLLGQNGRVVEASQNVFAGKRGVLRQKIVYGVAVCQHPDDLVHGDARALHARLTATDLRIDANSLERHALNLND